VRQYRVKADLARRYAEQSKLGRRSGNDAWTRAQQKRAHVRAKRDVLRLRYGGKQ